MNMVSRVQLAGRVIHEHGFQGDRLDLGGHAGGAEGFVAGLTDAGHCLGGFLEEFARVEVGLVLGQVLAHGTGRSHTQVGVDVDFAYTGLDAFNDLFNRYAIGLAHVAAVVVDDLEPVLRYGRGTVHYQVNGRNALVDLFHAVDTQDLAGRLLGEFVSAVGSTDGDSQGINAGLLDEVSRFFRIGQQLGVVQHAFRTNAVFFTGHTGFQGAEAAQLTFNGNAAGVSHVDDFLGGFNVVLVAGRGLGVFHQGAVHHDGAEAGLDGTGTNRRRRTVVLVHDDRDMRVHFGSSDDQVTQEGLASVRAGACRTLQDHRAVNGIGSLHDGMHLLHVVDVECGQTVAVLGSVVQ